MNIVITGIIIFIITFLLLSWFAKQKTKKIAKGVRSLIVILSLLVAIILAIGGRVLNFTSLSEDYGEARQRIHENLKRLNWNNGFYRRDIGHRLIDK